MKTIIFVIGYIAYGLMLIGYAFGLFILLPWAIYKYAIEPFISLFRKK